MINKNILIQFLVLIILFIVCDFAIFKILKTGLDALYGMNKRVEVICIGNSHTVAGIDAIALEKALKVPVAKYATSGINVFDRIWMVRQSIKNHPSIKMVIYDVDPRMFWTEDISFASYTLLLPYIDDPIIANYIKQETSWQEFYANRLLRTVRFQDHTLSQAVRGLVGKVEVEQNNIMRAIDFPAYLKRENRWSRKIRIDQKTLDTFKNTLNYLDTKGIQVVLIFIPLTDLVNRIDSGNQEKIIQLFHQESAKRKNVCFLDYNQDYQHNHKLFYDPWHMNKSGKDILTKRLAADLRLLLSTKMAQSKTNWNGHYENRP